MPKRLLLIITALMALLAPAGPAEAAQSDDEAQFVFLINELRSSLDLPPLTVHDELVGPSQAWASQLSAQGQLSHAGDLSVGVTADWTKLGENVGVASQGQIQQLFDAFVASPGHYANLVDPSFRHVGVGVVYDGQGRIWTTHRFMALRDEFMALQDEFMALQDEFMAPGDATAGTTAPPTPPTTAAPAAAPVSVAPSTTPLPAATDEAPPERLAFTDDAAMRPAAVAYVVDDLVGSGI